MLKIISLALLITLAGCATAERLAGTGIERGAAPATELYCSQVRGEGGDVYRRRAREKLCAETMREDGSCIWVTVECEHRADAR